jgi:hypothetical protein
VSEQDSGVASTSFTVARRFRIWRYGVGHQTLVLRSLARFAGDETVDACFDGVAAVHLHQGFEPLTIRAADPDERGRIFAWAAADIYDVEHRPPLCLILASARPDGFVVCAHARLQTSRHDPPTSHAAADDAHDSTTRTLWYAGPSGNPAQRHEYRVVETAQDTAL